MSGGVALPMNCSSHTSKHPPDIILRRSSTRPSTMLAVIEAGNKANVGLVPKPHKQSGNETLQYSPHPPQVRSVG